VGRPLAGSPNGGIGQRVGPSGWGAHRFGPYGSGRGPRLWRPVYPRSPGFYPVWNDIPFYGGASAPPDYTNDYSPPDYNQEPPYPPLTSPSPDPVPQSSGANPEDFPATGEQTPATARTEMQLYRWVSQPLDDNDEHPSMIALKNRGMYTVLKYWSKGKVLNFITTQGDHMQVVLDQVDRIYPSSSRNKVEKAAKH
jgi:hypothetical protein